MTLTTRHGVLGLVLLMAIGGAVGLVVAAFGQKFTPTVNISVIGDRSGLLTEPGARVMMRGVRIGRVPSVEQRDEHAVMTVAIQREFAEKIPANVTARLASPTVFGAKAVELVPPRQPSAGHIQEGAVLTDARVTTEINTLFENAMSLLKKVKPAELHYALGSMSTALKGQGEQFGAFLEQFNSYLEALNPAVRTLGKDFADWATVADDYDRAAPDFLRGMANLGETGATLVEKRSALQAFLSDMSGFAGDTKRFMTAIEPDFVSAVRVFAPVNKMLARYSPQTVCTVKGINEIRKSGAYAVTGMKSPGVHFIITPSFGMEPYRYPEDLPIPSSEVPDVGPFCSGLPWVENPPYPRVPVYDGTKGSWPRNHDLSSDPLSVQLFGKDADLAAKVAKKVMGR